MTKLRVNKSVSAIKWKPPTQHIHQTNFTPNNSGNGNYTTLLVIVALIIIGSVIYTVFS